MVYNFEVEDFHTYYIGEHGVWVHNNECFRNAPSVERADGKASRRRTSCLSRHHERSTACATDLVPSVTENV
jgi:hypothetical protein